MNTKRIFTKKFWSTAMMLTLVGLLSGCGQAMITSKASNASATSLQSETPTTDADYACLDSSANLVLDTSIVSFEITDSAGVSFGFDLLTGLLKAIGISIKNATGKLVMDMYAYDPLNMTSAVALGSGSSSYKNINISADFDISLVKASASYYYSTPIGTLTQNAINGAVKAVNSDFATSGETWSTRIVTLLGSNEFLVPVGTASGIQLGDVFAIYDTDYEWQGAPCSSNLLMARKNSSTPIALATVVQLANSAADLVVTQVNSSVGIKKYDLVQISSLQKSSAGKARTSLSWAMKLNGVENSTIVFTDGSTDTAVDLSSYVSNQLQTTLSSSSYGGYLIVK